ncbi:MAG: hypothetical protein MJ250_08570 [Alphaproteobacteria bacterium]|nr:hypothetical protein [Alphaproteobacteria bacterium]
MKTENTKIAELSDDDMSTITAGAKQKREDVQVNIPGDVYSTSTSQKIELLKYKDGFNKQGFEPE